MAYNKKEIVDFTEFNVENVIFGEMSKTSVGSKTIPILYKYPSGATKSLLIFTPEMMTWGAKNYQTNVGADEDIWSMNIPLGRGVPEEFVNCIRSLDRMAKQHLHTNSKQIFNAVKSQEIIDELYMNSERPIVDKITGETTNTFLKVKLPSFGKKWNFAVFQNDASQTKLFPLGEDQKPDTVIPKSSQVQVLLSINSMWLTGGKIGFTLKAIQISVGSAEPSLMDVSAFPARKKAAVANSTDVNDSEDEDEEFGLNASEMKEY
jgi:hypothetical protein